ncbi:signal peptide peptidase SppA [Xanthobacter tagetidis]|jgi:protease-4|uniref:Signal peptide peptidase SppA n=1 Tax=Xanthobacter tagetidis TaxID=60216 RepID=A0A3L7AIS4_9HYPH|nr:signal peptide peptidase SppA [Xanthobacter tagetidis]MBB6307002.1 protease-4 [Xanthobacter tagetidis]RLP79944.1 signal peptide peptidase SppA [Xanthobacter tagetidis]
MSLDADQIVERRRLRRKVTFWRTLGVLAAVGALAVAVSTFAGNTLSPSTPHVARVVIGGVIRNDRERVKMLDEIADSRAAAVILSIDSPGGTVTGAEQLYDALQRLAKKKPVVAVVEGLAASGGYIAAIGADHIVARRNALVGSVGVIFQFPNVYELLKSVGIAVEDIKSSPLKAAPNGYTPTSPEARAAIDALVVDTYAWFKALVGDRRKLTDAQLATVADGRVFTGHQGLGLQLVDELGDETTARAWLAREKGVSEDLKVRTWRTGQRSSEFGWLSGAVGGIAGALGFPQLAAILSQATGAALERAQLDGLLALWHPQINR